MNISENILLKPYTTFGIGGAAEYFVEVADEKELVEAIAWAQAKGVPHTVLGEGSNVLISDEGVEGLVILNRIVGIKEKDSGRFTDVMAGAGEVFDDLVERTVSSGLWGLENLSCIPGLVGATPIQNIGAYGVEIGSMITAVYVYDTKDHVHTVLSTDECMFGYRDSMFKHEEGQRYIVTRVAYRLTKESNPVLHYKDVAHWLSTRDSDTEPTLSEIRAAICNIRSKKFPDWRTKGTAGSFFKNPIVSRKHWEELIVLFPEIQGHSTSDGKIKVSLGWILEHVLHARGSRVGNVGSYIGQALVLVNFGDATAEEVEVFAQTLMQKIFDATKISVEWEVTKKK